MTLHIAGQKFGRLLAVRYLRSEKKKAVWLFRCDCGAEPELLATFVKRGHTQSCGCLRIERAREAVLSDISGRRFGRLSVLCRSGFSRDGRVQWSCICDCGRTVDRSAKNQQNGTATSCGCKKAEAAAENVAAREVDFVGRRFGKLVVVSLASNDRAKRWLCSCDCGGKRIVPHGSLQQGRTVSCGCAAKERTSYMSADARAKGAAACARRRARKRQAGGSFTAEQIDELYKKQRGRCAWCHAKLTDKNMARDHRTALANGGSNEIGNIELTCTPCNLRKSAKDEIAWANERGCLL